MTSQRIPFAEVQLLIKISLDAYTNQYQVAVDRKRLNFRFIPARQQTLIGCEINTEVPNGHLSVRMYAERFVVLPDIKPFRLEDIQEAGNGDEAKVFVSISDLPIGLFPVLSKTLDPLYDNTPSPFAIELEDLSGFIQAETGDYLLTENAP